MTWTQPVTLHGQKARLEPLSQAYLDGLRRAASDGELWKLWYTNVPDSEGMAAEIDRRLNLQAAGSMLPFVVLDTSQTPVGMTSFMHIDTSYNRVEIGSTWYAKRVQRTGINTECKQLMLQYAFETRNCIAVEFRTSFFNQASRRAIERLGAKLDGILRNHQRHRDGSLRDTCCYSIIQSEWPSVKQHLEFCLRQRYEIGAS